MTSRLYYSDSVLLEFEARITATGNHDDLFYTVLDQSAFYPTSGGQLFDTGLINGVEVVEVIETPDGDVWHLSKSPVGGIGDEVKGVINPERRRRHRQQHTAQHILSHAFVKLFDLATVSVHLGEEYGTIELDGPALTVEQLRETERYARQLVDENLPVQILTVDENDIDSVPFRRKPKKKGRLRVIKIGELDWSACGGTHCTTTTEVGLIKILGTGKIRGHVLVKFLSGTQTIHDYDMRFDATDGLSQSLTCHVSDLPEKFEKLQNDNKVLARTLTQLRKDMLPAHADAMASSKTQVGSTDLVFEVLDDYDAKLANSLGTKVAEIVSGVAVIFLNGRIIVSTGETSGKDARQIVSVLSEKTGLKGGGSPRQAQLGGATAENLPQYREIVMSFLSDE